MKASRRTRWTHGGFHPLVPLAVAVGVAVAMVVRAITTAAVVTPMAVTAAVAETAPTAVTAAVTATAATAVTDARTATAASSNELLPSVLRQETRWVMGTSLKIVVVDEPVNGSERTGAQQTMKKAFAAAEGFDALLSNYEPRSPLSRVNQRAGEWVEVPRVLFDYLRRARRDTRRTDGCYDPTVGAVIGDPLAAGRAPDGGLIGMHRLQLSAFGSRFRARLSHVGMRLDPGADGKGVALDQMVEILRAGGIRDALINFGSSSIVGLGHPPEGDAWTVELRDVRGKVAGTIQLEDRALSTSASLHEDLSPADHEGSPSQPHIIDPRDGSWVRTARMVAVVSPSATDAEVLSTALVVDGTAGLRWLERFDGAHAVVLEAQRAPVMDEGMRCCFTPATR